MATSKNNVLTHGLSGTVGDLLVFRNRAGKTIVASKPRERVGDYTETQKMHQHRFQQATLYGQSIMADPALKAEYETNAKAGQSAYNVAVADFFHAPDIDSIDISAYTGKVGDTITITVTDNFKVTGVSVSIYNADGTEVEHGMAVQAANKVEWVFTAKTNNESIEGDKIEVRATDLPGNETEKTVGSKQ
jgi:hypothetical protein